MIRLCLFISIFLLTINTKSYCAEGDVVVISDNTNSNVMIGVVSQEINISTIKTKKNITKDDYDSNFENYISSKLDIMSNNAKSVGNAVKDDLYLLLNAKIETRKTYFTIDINNTYFYNIASESNGIGVSIGGGFTMWHVSGLYASTSIDAFINLESSKSISQDYFGGYVTQKLGYELYILNNVSIIPYFYIGGGFGYNASVWNPAIFQGIGGMLAFKTNKSAYFGFFGQFGMSESLNISSTGSMFNGVDLIVSVGIQFGA